MSWDSWRTYDQSVKTGDTPSSPFALCTRGTRRKQGSSRSLPSTQQWPAPSPSAGRTSSMAAQFGSLAWMKHIVENLEKILTPARPLNSSSSPFGLLASVGPSYAAAVCLCWYFVGREHTGGRGLADPVGRLPAGLTLSSEFALEKGQGELEERREVILPLMMLLFA